ncbi:MAG: hypothetical protein ACRC7O_06325 [Fimbriiglobus sp.]
MTKAEITTTINFLIVKLTADWDRFMAVRIGDGQALDRAYRAHRTWMARDRRLAVWRKRLLAVSGQ